MDEQYPEEQQASTSSDSNQNENQSVIDAYLQGKIPFHQYIDSFNEQEELLQGSRDYHDLQPSTSTAQIDQQEVGVIELSFNNSPNDSDDHKMFLDEFQDDEGMDSSYFAGEEEVMTDSGENCSPQKKRRFTDPETRISIGSDVPEEYFEDETQTLLEDYRQSLGDAGMDYDCSDSSTLFSPSRESTSSFTDGTEEKRSKRRVGRKTTNRPAIMSLVRTGDAGSRKNSSERRKTKDVAIASKAIEEEDIFEVPEEWRVDGKLDKDRPLRRLPETLQALIGQANLYYVQGRKEEALNMMQQVVLEHPKNPEPYSFLSTIFEDLGEKGKQLQFGLLAAYLDYLTPGSTWELLGGLAIEIGRKDQALLCFSKAIRAESDNWSHYKNKLALLEEKNDIRAMIDTKNQALRHFKETPDNEWYINLAKETIDMAIKIGDYSDTESLHKLLLNRLKEMGQTLDYKHVIRYVDSLKKKKNYREMGIAIFKYSELKAIDASGEICVDSEQLFPFPPLDTKEYQIPQDFPLILKIRLVNCFVEIDRMDLAQPMLVHLDQECKIGIEFLELVHIFFEKKLFDRAEFFLAKLTTDPELGKEPRVWIALAEVSTAQSKNTEACNAYNKVLELEHEHVEARMSLAGLQERMGQSNEALETLKVSRTPERFDVQSVEFKDERLLHKECLIYHSQRKTEEFLKTAYRLLAPYFYEIYAAGKEKRAVPVAHYRDGRGMRKISLAVRRAVLDMSRDSLLERLIKKIGMALSAAGNPVSEVSISAKRKYQSLQPKVLLPDQIHGVCFKVCEILFEQEQYEEMTQIAGYALNCPWLLQRLLHTAYARLMLLGAIKSRNSKIVFTLLVNNFNDQDRPRIWNLFGFTFLLNQDVNQHRVILRLAAKSPENHALTILSGNNSLVSGTYSHALTEYVTVLNEIPGEPLINLLTGLTCIHIGCKKDISRRHDMILQGFAFLYQYEQLRGECQETMYNLGRTMHQLNILYAAIHYYKKVLDSPETIGKNEAVDSKKVYSLKKLAAHNLSLIYMNSGNDTKARELLKQYCVI